MTPFVCQGTPYRSQRAADVARLTARAKKFQPRRTELYVCPEGHWHWREVEEA